MGLTQAMLVGFTGIKSNQSTIDAVGDNVANVNTTAFKSQRALFETVYYRTIDPGSGPDAATNNGGSNPVEVGLGSRLATLQRNFEPGTIQGTGVKSDVAIDGAGFLILEDSDGTQLYTRDGAMVLDENNDLVSSSGAYVKGFAADANGEIITGALSNLNIPLGTESEAIATTSAEIEGNLDAAADLGATGAVTQTGPLATAAGPATAATQLTSLVDGDGQALFTAGDVITLRNIQKGGVDIPEKQFVVGTDGSTLGDFANFVEQVTAIDTSVPTPSGQTPGVTIDATGAMVITANAGEANAISIDPSDIRNATTGKLPFSFTSTPATGEGLTTAFTVYDSLGNPVEVRLRMAMESRDDSGTTWRFFAESNNDSDTSPLLGTGTLSFDQNGELVASTGTTVNVDLANNGGANPLAFELDVNGVTGLNFGNGTSTLVMATQDGAPGGTLIDYAIDADGVITGTFSNGRTRSFGQLALATFRNPAGLNGLGDNTFAVGINSGEAMVTAPRTEGAGAIQSNALELSNVELSREFINLITASTGFSAASRVVRSADDLLQELMLLAR
ncbi:MAG: flagellar hook-basal body complex protein [Phycisphaerales bacterium]|nr:flagellar hook-basal body complex protein [Phycisphaerales bacterium]